MWGGPESLGRRGGSHRLSAEGISTTVGSRRSVSGFDTLDEGVVSTSTTPESKLPLSAPKRFADNAEDDSEDINSFLGLIDSKPQLRRSGVLGSSSNSMMISSRVQAEETLRKFGALGGSLSLGSLSGGGGGSPGTSENSPRFGSRLRRQTSRRSIEEEGEYLESSGGSGTREGGVAGSEGLGSSDLDRKNSYNRRYYPRQSTLRSTPANYEGGEEQGRRDVSELSFPPPPSPPPPPPFARGTSSSSDPPPVISNLTFPRYITALRSTSSQLTSGFDQRLRSIRAAETAQSGGGGDSDPTSLATSLSAGDGGGEGSGSRSAYAGEEEAVGRLELGEEEDVGRSHGQVVPLFALRAANAGLGLDQGGGDMAGRVGSGWGGEGESRSRDQTPGRFTNHRWI